MRTIQKRFVTGSKSALSNGFCGAPEPSRDLFIYRVGNNTTTEVLKDYIEELNVTVRDLQCVSNDESKFKSFKLTVPISNFKQLFDESIWPAGVRVRKFIPPRRFNTDFYSS